MATRRRALRLGGEEHAGEDRAESSARPLGRPGAARPRVGRRQGDRVAGGSARCRNSSAGIRRSEKSRATGGDADLPSTTSKLTAPGSRERTMSEASLGDHRDAVGLAVHGGRHRDGQVEVAAGDGEAVASQLGARRRTGRAPPRLAAARPAVLTASVRTSRSQRNFTWSLLGTSPVAWEIDRDDSSKGCGLWIMPRSRRSAGAIHRSRARPQGGG